MIVGDRMVMESEEAEEAKNFVLSKNDNARCRLFSRSGIYKVLPYGSALAKNAIGQGDSREDAWIDAQRNMLGGK
jgi:hypothetical protein